MLYITLIIYNKDILLFYYLLSGFYYLLFVLICGHNLSAAFLVNLALMCSASISLANAAVTLADWVSGVLFGLRGGGTSATTVRI
jgi:hypothetical protein